MKTTNSIVEYIENNQRRRNIRWRIYGGRCFFELFPGCWQHEHLFDSFFPQYEYVRFNDKGSNPDKTKIA